MASITDHSMPAPGRRFLLMLGLSIGLHGAILAWVKGPRDTDQLQKVLSATLRIAMPAPAESAPPPQAPPETTTPKVQKVVRQFPLQREPRLERAAESTPSSPSPREAAPAAAVSEAPATAVAPTAASPVAVVPAPAPRDQAALLDGYSHRLSELFARQQEYPRIAAVRGWEGEVRLRIKVARKGNLLGVVLDHSSGFDVLDQHALQLVQQLHALPPLPEGLEAGEIQVIVPVNYRLRKPA